MKKFFTLIIAVMLMTLTALQTPASAETPDDAAFRAMKELGASIEKFYATLPKSTQPYDKNLQPILIQGAMSIETEILVRALKNPVTFRVQNYFFAAGTLENYPVVVSRTEVGMANAAASAALAIEYFNPIAVLNQGTAGSHDVALKVDTIILGERSINLSSFKSEYSPAGAGIDITRQNLRGIYAYADDGTFQPHEEFFADKILLETALKTADAHKEFTVTTGTISTNYAWINSVDYINFLHEKYGSTCEEMETNATAQICHNSSVPFLGIRVISNNILRDSNFAPESSDVAQNFTLLVAKEYIRGILRR